MKSITLGKSNDCQPQRRFFGIPCCVEPGGATLEMPRMERLINANGDAFQQ